MPIRWLQRYRRYDTSLCIFTNPAFIAPSPPPPTSARAPSAPGTTINTTNVVQIKIITSGTTAEWDASTPDGADRQSKLKLNIGGLFTPPATESATTLEITAGSVNIVSSTDVGDASNLASFTAQANAALGGSPETASAALGITVNNNPVAIATQTYSILAPPSAPLVYLPISAGDDSVGVIVGAAVGGAVGVAMIGAIVWYVQRRSASKVAA